MEVTKNISTTQKMHFISQIGLIVEEKLLTEQNEQLQPKQVELLAKIHLKQQKWVEKQLPPLAIIPTQLWNHLCEKFDIYRFEHFLDNGSVPCKPKNLIHPFVYIAAIPVGCYIWYLELEISEQTNGRIEAGIILMLFILLLLVLRPLVFDIYTNNLRKKGKSTAALFFPQKYSDSSFVTENFNAMCVTIKFPQAPNYVKKLIDKLIQGQIPFCIAAEEEGIDVIRDSLRHIFLPNLNGEDPIVYTKEDDFVVVLAQYGDFSKEQELIAYIKKLNIAHFV